MSEMMRLQRYIAQAGVASRRKAEELITAGRVRVNGKRVTELGTQVNPARDRVEVDDRLLVPEALVYLLLNKPQGYVTTVSDPEGRPTVMDLLPEGGPRLYPVGRLDVSSEGVLLFTNDGDLAHALTHPSHRIQKRYLVRVRGPVDEPTLQALSAGPELEDGPTHPTQVLVRADTGSHTWLEITVTEGRNRLVRRMCEAVGLQVARLIRTRFAGLETEPLRKGAWRTLTAEEVARLRRLAGLPSRRYRPRLSTRSGPPGVKARPRRADRRGARRGARAPRTETAESRDAKAPRAKAPRRGKAQRQDAAPATPGRPCGAPAGGEPPHHTQRDDVASERQGGRKGRGKSRRPRR